jgi:hypothetical protein
MICTRRDPAYTRNPANHSTGTQHDAAWWNSKKSAIIQNLHDKAAAIYNRVKTARTGSDAFSAQLFGNQTILNEVDFHAHVGNHRIRSRLLPTV